MATADLKTIAQKMRKLDIATFTTVTISGALKGRPMSNNGDVEYDGSSYYFTEETASLVADVGVNPNVELGFEGEDGLFISVSGKAELIREKAEFEKHWMPELDRWFDDGIDTPSLVLVCVKAQRAKYWQDEESGEWKL